MIWYRYRPDALYALEDPKIRKTLRRYISILEKETLPKFILAKHFEIEFNPKENIEELIDIHNSYLQEFMKFVKEYDNEKFQLNKPKYSFLDLKITIADKLTESCEFCEWRCKVNRKVGEKGFCRVRYKPKISSMFIHLGEESWITPSFTVFFAGCNFKCIYCQNWDISQNPENGEYIEEEKLALEIENAYSEGARNVNFVGGEPTPNLHYVLKVLKYVNSPIPVVWNSNAYESEIGQKLLAGIVDIYLYDFKYGNNDCALKYSKIPRYFETVTRNFKFAINYGEISFRILVLPNHIECCAKPILKWIKENLEDRVIVQLLSQYRPEYKACEYPEICRTLTKKEYLEVVRYAEKIGLVFEIQ